MSQGCPPPTGSPPHETAYKSVEIIIGARTAEQNKANTNRNLMILKFMVFHLLYFWLKNTYNAYKNKKCAKPNQYFSLIYHILLQITVNVENPERAYSKVCTENLQNRTQNTVSLKKPYVNGDDQRNQRC